jgi:F0F1-type ATP synthase delta subunit
LASTEDAAKFSKEKTGTAVDGYVATAHKLSENAWQRIIDACNEHTAQAVETIVEDIDLSLDGLREDLYEPSSP